MVTIRFPILIIFVLSLIAAAYLGFSSIHLNHDKLIHFITFFILTVEFYFIFDSNLKSLKILRYITFIICTCSLSIGSELVQNIVNPKRVFDIYDIVCNILGSIIGLILVSLYQHWLIMNKRKNRARKQPPIIEEQDESTSDLLDDDYVSIQMKDVANNP